MIRTVGRRRIPRRIEIWLQIIGSITCFTILFSIVPLTTFAEVLGKGSVGPLLVVACLVFPAILTRAWRWYFILRSGAVEVSFASITTATLIGMALNLVLPASGGDVARSYFGWRQHGRKEAMLSSAVADKCVALLSISLLGMMSAVIIGNVQVALLISLIVLPLLVVLVWPLRFPWTVVALILNRILRTKFDVDVLVEMFRMKPRVLLGAFAISILGWICTNGMYQAALVCFGADVRLGYVFAVAPLINLCRILPISVSGLGSADALMVYLFAEVGVPAPVTLAAAMIINVVLIAIPGLFGGVLLGLNRGRWC